MAQSRPYQTDDQSGRQRRSGDWQSGNRDSGQYGRGADVGRDRDTYGRQRDAYSPGSGLGDYAQSRPLDEDFGQPYDRPYDRGYGAQGGYAPQGGYGGQGGYGRGDRPGSMGDFGMLTPNYGGRGQGSYDRNRYSGGYDDQRRGYQTQDRGFMERAGDEISSWFGDEDAQRRRDIDHRGKGPKGYTRSDDRIRDDVNDRLSDDSMLDASDIEVSVAEGEITLSGEVNSRQSKRRAEDCIEWVAGVKHVQNNLRVKSVGSSTSSLGDSMTTNQTAGSVTGKPATTGNSTRG